MIESLVIEYFKLVFSERESKAICRSDTRLSQLKAGTVDGYNLVKKPYAEANWEQERRAKINNHSFH